MVVVQQCQDHAQIIGILLMNVLKDMIALIKEFLAVLLGIMVSLIGFAILYLFILWLGAVTLPEDHCQKNPDDIVWCD